ncbi:MAG: hypothetical protein AB7U82_35470 [Blastocatellales bacterium]|nr:hypothetical protein [Nitrosomonas nitrosa]
MNRTRQTGIFIGVVIGCLLVANGLSAPTSWQSFSTCERLATNAAEKIAGQKSLAIRLFSLKNPALYRKDTGQPFYTAEPLEKVQLAFAEKLGTQLQQTRHFRVIVIARDDALPQTDLVLEGEFTAIYQLGGKVQLMAYPVTRMAVNGRLKWRETSQQIVEFSCWAAREAGLLNRPKKQMHKNIEKITDGLKTLLVGQRK